MGCLSIWTITSVAALDNLARPQANELSARIVTFIYCKKNVWMDEPQG